MNTKLIGILCVLLFILGSTFAAAPTVSNLVTSPAIVTNDLNYFSFPLDINAVATGADLNADVLCFYKLTTSSEPVPTTFDGDSNTCMVLGLTSGAGDDWNFSMIVQSSTLDANGTSEVEYTWRDNTAPTTTASAVKGNPSAVTITSVDAATTTGDGSGVKSITYWVAGGSLQTSLTNPATFNISTPGFNTVTYCAIDNLDNNECAATIRSSTFYVGDVTNSACGMLGLVVIVLAALILVGIMIFGIAGGLDSTSVIPLIIAAIVGVISIIIISEILVPVCAVV